MLDEREFNKLVDKVTTLEKILVKNKQTNEVVFHNLSIPGSTRQKKYKIQVNDVDPNNLSVLLTDAGDL